MAKDVITRFKLETTAFDSAIKKASKELSDYSKTATKAKEGFNEFTKSNVDAARALGTMATSSTNTKQKLQELVCAYNEGVKAYKALSDEHKKSDWAQALAGSLTQLQQRIRETKQEMQSMESKSGGLFGSDKLSGMLQVMGGNLMTKGVTIAAGAVTSMVNEIGDAVKQGIELAKQGEGIRIAFERLGRGDILDGLRQATHGTVTDLELMKAAVKFNDFKLPIEELGTMLAFAQQKAKDTGQSVDYMVDSIVTGLGRKSLMILDNLGLSATEIKDRMKETGDMTKAVGAIIREQMAKAGDYVETAADRAAQANVNLQNKMEELGRKFAPIEEASNQLWTSMKIGILDIIGGPLATLLNQLTEAGRLKNALNDINGDGSSGNTVVGGKLKQLQAAKNSGASQYMLNTMQSSTIEGYNRQIMKADELLKQFEKNHSSVNVVLQNATKQFGQKFSSISELEAFRDAYKVMVSDYRKGASEIMKPVKVNIQTNNAIKSVDELKVKLAELQAQRKKVAAGSDEAKRLDTEIRQVKSDIKLQDPKANTSSKTVQTEIQKNDEKIKKLSVEYAKLGDSETEASRKRQEEIQKEIQLLQQRNGLLGLRAEHAQGRMLLNAGDMDKTGLGNLMANPFAGDSKSIGGLKLTLDDKAMKAVTEGVQKSLPKRLTAEQKIEGMRDLVGGINNVFSGIQQIGIDIPEEISKVMGVLNGIFTVVSGIESIITVGQFLGLFSRGGVVPHAADGYFVGGNRYSGDTTPIMANAGELVLNKSSQNNLASDIKNAESLVRYISAENNSLSSSQQQSLAGTLQDGGLKEIRIVGKLSGEDIVLSADNWGKRTGKGELVWWRR